MGLTNAAPQRLRLSRRAGFNLQQASMALNGLRCVVVSRPSKFGNIFIAGKEHPFIPGRIIQDRRHAYLTFKSFAGDNGKLVRAAQAELVGLNLACWCPLPHEPYQEDECHAAVLLEIANR